MSDFIRINDKVINVKNIVLVDTVGQTVRIFLEGYMYECIQIGFLDNEEAKAYLEYLDSITFCSEDVSPNTPEHEPHSDERPTDLKV